MACEANDTPREVAVRTSDRKTVVYVRRDIVDNMIEILKQTHESIDLSHQVADGVPGAQPIALPDIRVLEDAINDLDHALGSNA